MCKYGTAEERVAKNQKTTVRHFGFTVKVYGLPCTVCTLLLWKRHLEMPLWELTGEIFMHVITKVTLMMFDDVPNSIIATMHSAAE